MTQMLIVIWSCCFVALIATAMVVIAKIYFFLRTIKNYSPKLYDELGKPHILESNSLHIFKKLKSLQNQTSWPDEALDDARQGSYASSAHTIVLLQRVFNGLFVSTLLIFIFIFLSR